MNAAISFPQPIASDTRRGPGRPPGSANKLPKDLRAKLRNILEGSASDVWGWLERTAQTDPDKAVALWISLAQFVLPRLSAVATADITPAPAPIRERIARAGVDERLLLSSRAATLIASGQVESLDDLLGHITEHADDEAVDALPRTGEVIDIEAEAVEPIDPLLR